jgi:hypothetical protein
VHRHLLAVFRSICKEVDLIWKHIFARIRAAVEV